MPNRKKQEIPSERLYMKRKAQNSFSIPKDLKAGMRRSTKTMSRELYHPEEKATNEKPVCSCTSTEAGSDHNSNESTLRLGSSVSDVEQDDISSFDFFQISSDSESQSDDDGWETETDSSVEEMRSECLSLDECVIPLAASIRNIDSVSSTFLDHEHCPVSYSTPISHLDSKKFRPSEPAKQPPDIPNISYENDFVKDGDTLEDVQFDWKPISPEQSIQLPDVPNEDINKESKEQRKDSFTCSKVASSDEFQVSEGSDERTKQNFDEDGEYSKSKSFGVTVMNKSTNSNSRKQKEDKVEDSFEYMNDHSNKNGSGRVQNMQIDSKKKRKGFHHMNDSLTKWRAKHKNRTLFEYSDSEDDFENAQKNQNKELQDDESDNNQPEIATDVRKRKNNNNVGADNITQQDASITNVSKSSTSLKRKLKNEGENLFVNMNKSDGENFENIQNIRNEDDELNNNQPEIAALQMERTRKKWISVDNKTHQDTSILNRSQNSTYLRRKHKNEGENLSKDMNKSDRNGSLEKGHTIQNEELQDYEPDNNPPETAAHRRKTTNQVKFTSFGGGTTNSNEKTKHWDKIRNSPEIVDIYNKEDNFEEAQNIEISTPKRKVNINRGTKMFMNRIRTFKDMNESDSEGNLENIQNEVLQDNELDNNQPETTTDQIKRKNNKHVEVDNITQQDVSVTNRSQSSTSLRRNYKTEGENSHEDMNESGNEDRFENIQSDRDEVGNYSSDNLSRGESFEDDKNMEIASTSMKKKKRKPYRRVGIKSRRLLSRSGEATNSFSRLKNSTGLEVYEDVENNQNEAIKSNWPRCCLESSKTETVPILKPVFRDDLPIDTIAMLAWGWESKRKCKH